MEFRAAVESGQEAGDCQRGRDGAKVRGGARGDEHRGDATTAGEREEAVNAQSRVMTNEGTITNHRLAITKGRSHMPDDAMSNQST